MILLNDSSRILVTYLYVISCALDQESKEEHPYYLFIFGLGGERTKKKKKEMISGESNYEQAN